MKCRPAAFVFPCLGEKEKDFLGALLFEENPKGDPHPPWYVHLYFADLIAGLLETEKLKCLGSAPNKTNSNDAIVAIPPPLTAIENLACSDPIIHFSTMRKRGVADGSIVDGVGSYQMVPEGSWDVMTDLPGKPPGFVSYYKNQSEEGSRMLFSAKEGEKYRTEDINTTYYHVNILYLQVCMNVVMYVGGSGDLI